MSRRAVVYTMQGFSFREFIGLETGVHLGRLTFDQITKNHIEEAQKINEAIKPFQYFNQYLQYGYYPLYKEQLDLFLVDDTFIFEIGGNRKRNRQIKSIENGFVVYDVILYGFQNKIPLWLFGFLY